MAKYKIGITEHGDASLDLSWVDRLPEVDGAVLVTKEISHGLRDAVLANKEKLILHATTTGYGGTVLEPYVPPYHENLNHVLDLVNCGFPADHVVIRIDPIIPTEKGLALAFNVFKDAIDLGFTRFRVSIIDMYDHVCNRFVDAGLPLPYGYKVFQPSKKQIAAVDDMLTEVRRYYCGKEPFDGFKRYDTKEIKDVLRNLSIECCAEPELKNAQHCGCISDKDLELLCLENDDDGIGYQRKHCMCYSGKVELLKSKHPCGHQCLYCFWK